jgi:predicted nuclease of predicted toxin-antitoxin system
MPSAIRFLIDNALSPALAEALRGAGHDAVHVRDRQMGAASDQAIFDLAQRERRVIVSADTDFGTILAQRKAAEPSVILFRRNTGRRPTVQFELLMKNLHQIANALESGSVVVIEADRIRIRALPLSAP